MNKRVYTKISNDRKPDFSIYTEIYIEDDNKYVKKNPTTVSAERHISRMMESREILEKKYQESLISIADATMDGNSIKVSWAPGEAFSVYLDMFLFGGDIDKWKNLADKYFEEYLQKEKTEFEYTEEFKKIFNVESELLERSEAVRNVDIDAIFGNVNYDAGKWWLYDYEWLINEPIPARYFMFRCLLYYLNDSEHFKYREDLYKLYDFSDEEIRIYTTMEENFQKFIKGNGTPLWKQAQMCNLQDEDIVAYYENIQNDLQENCRTLSEKLEAEIYNADMLKKQLEQQREVNALSQQHIRNITAINEKLMLELSESLLRRFLKRHRWTNWIIKLKDNGIKHYLGKVSYRIQGLKYPKFTKEKLVLSDPTTEVGQNVKSLLEIKELDEVSKSIAVHLHLFYVDLLEEFIWYLNNMPYQFDLFISVMEDADVMYIERRCKKIKNCGKTIIKKVPNRGRDIAPLYVHFREEIEKYDYFLHMHSKKSLYTGNEQVGWRQMSLDSLLGSPEIIKKIFSIFEQKTDAGLIFPEYYESFCMFHCSWLTNAIIGEQFLKRIPAENESMMFHYPAGSFFWARTEAVRPLFDMRLQLTDFPEERGQVDTTTAHVLERAIAVVASNRGYHGYLIDLQEGVCRRRKSLKLFRDYMNENAEVLLNQMLLAKTVSFDVFGTLVAEKLYKREDLYQYMYENNTSYCLDKRFAELRVCAEKRAVEKNGPATNLAMVYAEYGKMCGDNISDVVLCELMKYEVDCLASLCVARIEIQSVFNALQKAGKQIIVTEDTIYSTEEIAYILDKCGYHNISEFWISNEKGARKDEDKLWDEFYAKYPSGVAHVGDNPRADWQTVEDRKQWPKWIMNAKDEFVMSDVYDEYNLSDFADYKKRMELGAMIAERFNSPYILQGPEGKVEETYDII